MLTPMIMIEPSSYGVEAMIYYRPGQTNIRQETPVYTDTLLHSATDSSIRPIVLELFVSSSEM